MLLELEGLVHEAFATAPLSPIPGIHRFLDELRAAGVPWALGTSAAPEMVEMRVVARPGR